jgi:lysophospholipase L1-like esterase
MKPRLIAYTIWITIVLLGVVCILVPENGWHIAQWNLRFPTLSEALDLKSKSTLSDSIALDEWGDMPEDTTRLAVTTDSLTSIPIPHDSANSSKQVPVQMLTVIEPQEVEDLRHYLTAFYLALDSADNKPIRIVHFGDSQIEEDRMTNVLRENWQKTYGGGGVGLIPLHQTVPSRSIRQYISMNNVIQSAQAGPKRYIVYGPRSMRWTNDDGYGVMGQFAMMDTALVKGSQDIVLHVEPAGKKLKSHNYFNRVRVLTDSVDGWIAANDTVCYPDSTYAMGAYYHLPDSSKLCDIHLHGRGRVYGISIETDKGVIVDNIPMRGCSGNIFTRIDSAQLSTYFRETNTRLIILQYGGNMIPHNENRSTVYGYAHTTMRQQVQYLRSCAPQASILFVGPSDMSTNVDGVMTTYPLLPYLDQMLCKMAQEEKIAYWSLYRAMGGYNSMVTWQEKGLAGSDYVHFTRAGANKAGKMLVDWIDEWKREYQLVQPDTISVADSTMVQNQDSMLLEQSSR